MQCRDMARQMLEDIKQGSHKMIREMHFMTAGMKAFYTWMVCDGLETAR